MSTTKYKAKEEKITLISDIHYSMQQSIIKCKCTLWLPEVPWFALMGVVRRIFENVNNLNKCIITAIGNDIQLEYYDQLVFHTSVSIQDDALLIDMICFLYCSSRKIIGTSYLHVSKDRFLWFYLILTKNKSGVTKLLS